MVWGWAFAVGELLLSGMRRLTLWWCLNQAGGWMHTLPRVRSVGRQSHDRGRCGYGKPLFNTRSQLRLRRRLQFFARPFAWSPARWSRLDGLPVRLGSCLRGTTDDAGGVTGAELNLFLGSTSTPLRRSVSNGEGRERGEQDRLHDSTTPRRLESSADGAAFGRTKRSASGFRLLLSEGRVRSENGSKERDMPTGRSRGENKGFFCINRETSGTRRSAIGNTQNGSQTQKYLQSLRNDERGRTEDARREEYQNDLRKRCCRGC